MTVLHLHVWESLSSVGPKYEYPGIKGSIVNAAKESARIVYIRQALVLTAAITS